MKHITCNLWLRYCRHPVFTILSQDSSRNGAYSVNRNFYYFYVERKVFRDFWDDNEDTLDDDQDPRISPYETIRVTLNKSCSSEIDSTSFMSKENSSLDENNEVAHDHCIAASTSTLSKRWE